ncbi:MAG: hypothetical protein JJV89_04815 [Desulfosarcina sp.]|nr:hypothetical protein [Desulfobacterales bacterium]
MAELSSPFSVYRETVSAGGETVDCDDNCPDNPNPAQSDSNGNGIGDVCD